jgi:hypothetical protein
LYQPFFFGSPDVQWAYVLMKMLGYLVQSKARGIPYFFKCWKSRPPRDLWIRNTPTAVVVVVMCSAFAEGCIGQLTPALCTNVSVPIHSLLSHCCAAHQAGMSRYVPVRRFGLCSISGSPQHYRVFCSYGEGLSGLQRCACHCCSLNVALVGKTVHSVM